MRITFWGTRGSLPSPLNANEFKIKVKRLLMNAHNINLKNEASIEAYLDESPLQYATTFGGNTPCVEITEGNNQLILDCGSGIRELGKEMMKRGLNPGK